MIDFIAQLLIAFFIASQSIQVSPAMFVVYAKNLVKDLISLLTSAF